MKHYLDLDRSRWLAGVALTVALVCIWGMASPENAAAKDFDKVLAAEAARIQLAQASQENVNKVAKETQDLESEYRRLIEELNGLDLYNDYMERQIANQMLEIDELRHSINQVSTVERQIMPLMIRMLDALDSFVNLDMAFLQTERRERVEKLKKVMERADLSVSEKFRRLTEAYQIEMEFGRTIESYKETLVLEGSTLEVSILRLGRIGLYYQTSDASKTGWWDQKSGQWKSLDGNKARNQVRRGLKIAQQQVAPDLILLPIAAPEDAQ